ncbi:MAG: sensor histidine kinase [Rhodospirillales bacterium]
MIRVLLVEDDPAQTAVMLATLGAIPEFEASAARTLAEGLAAAENKGPFDAVLLDLNLPDSEPHETAARFCRAHPEAAVVVLTAEQGEDRPEQALRAGAQDYLQKDGVSRNMLVRVIRNSIERKAVEQRLRASERKNREYAADVAHELRTPLTILRLQSETAGPPETSAAMRESIDRMARLVEQILAHAEADAAAESEHGPIDLAALAHETATLIAPAALESGHDIAFEGPGAPVVIRGAADPAAQAVRNLIENALKYSEPGTEVVVSAAPDGSVSVRDRGPGIPEDQRGEIFKRFLRADRRPKGAGLGLSIVKKIMDAHGGGVEITDAPGGGAVFTLRFPLDSA